MNRRIFIFGGLLLLPEEAMAKKRKRKKNKDKVGGGSSGGGGGYQMPEYLYIRDYTPSRWEPYIRDAVNVVDDLLPNWYPTLMYQRMGVIADGYIQKEGCVNIFERTTMHVPGAVGEAHFKSEKKVPGHHGSICLKEGYTANRYLVIHELYHTLADHPAHDGWQLWDVPFDASQVLLNDNNGG